MTGKSPRKQVDAFYWQGRLRTAKAYLESAQQAMLLAEPTRNGNPIISQIVLAAIAYGDCLTAKRGAKATPIKEAARLLADLESFAHWAEDLL